jgi:hypothetical protein
MVLLTYLLTTEKEKEKEKKKKGPLVTNFLVSSIIFTYQQRHCGVVANVSKFFNISNDNLSSLILKREFIFTRKKY